MGGIKPLNRISNKQIFFYLLIYKFIIEFMYIYVISPSYSYSGLTLRINIEGFWISNIFLLLLVFFSPKDKSRPSTYLFIILKMFLIIPTISYYWLNNQSLNYTVFVVLSAIIICLVLKIKLPSINIKDQTSKIWLNVIFSFYLLITIYLIYLRGGIDPRAFNFDEIYDLRSENDLAGISGYLMNWSTKVLCPFFFTYFYFKRKYLLMLPILILQLMMYLSFGNKAFLFSIGILLLTILITKRKNFVREIALSMSLLNVVAYLLDTLMITDALKRAIPYRLTFIPTQIQFQYYDFFYIRDKLYFADGIIGKILMIDSPYGEKIGFVIGRYFSHNGLGSNSNTGIFADAYANGGILIMILVSLIFGALLSLIDASTRDLPNYVVVGSFSYIMFVLNDTALLTTLLTGGMLLMMLMLLLLNSSISHNNGMDLCKVRKTKNERDYNDVNKAL